MRPSIFFSILALPFFLSSAPASAGTTVENRPCPKGTPANVRCGVLTVPASHEKTDGPSISTPFIDIRIGAPDPNQPPLLFLTGGPGGRVRLETAEDIAPWIELAASLAPASSGGRRAILAAQRGAAQPLASLFDCAELFAPEIRLGGPSTDPVVRKTVALCRDRATSAGIAPEIFSTAASVADLMVLRRGLNLPSWIPFGFSYGTRLALELARADGGGAAALILDAPDPPGDAKTQEQAASLQAALERLDALCQAQASCAAAAPNIPDLANRAALLLDRKPRRLKLLFGGTDKAVTAEVNGRDFLMTLGRALRDPSMAEWIPRAVAAGARNNWRPFASLMSILEAAPQDLVWGMGVAVDCQDFDTAETAAIRRASEKAAAVYAGIQPLREVFPDGLCTAWLGHAPKPPAATPVKYEKPTLILAGDLDPATPADAARRLANGLGRNARVIVYPRLGHVVTGQAACARTDVRNFLEGTLKDGISACDGQIPALEFPLPR